MLTRMASHGPNVHKMFDLTVNNCAVEPNFLGAKLAVKTSLDITTSFKQIELNFC